MTTRDPVRVLFEKSTVSFVVTGAQVTERMPLLSTEYEDFTGALVHPARVAATTRTAIRMMTARMVSTPGSGR